MKVVISSTGRFHAFRLAEQLERKNCLYRIYTQAPRRFSDRIPFRKIRGVCWLKLLRFLEYPLMLLPFFSGLLQKFISYKKKIHKKFVLSELDNVERADILIAWGGSGVELLKKAKNKGLLTIIDFGSAHPLFNRKLYRKELSRLKKKSHGVTKNDRMISDIVREFESCDYITLASRFAEQTFIKEGIAKSKILRVPYGVDTDMFYPIKKNDEIFRVVFCGSVSFMKGVHYLVKAFNKLDLPGSELVLIGGVDKDMANFLNKHSGDNIKVLGPKPQKSLYRYYSRGSVFVFPSLSDGFGMVILEAMACGLPVICSENTGGNDVIREGVDGYVVPAGDHKVLMEKIRILYDDCELRKKMARNSKRRARHFSWKKYGDRIVSKYVCVMKERRQA